MTKRVLASLLLASSLAACAQPYFMRPGDLQPMSAQLPPGERTVAWQRAIGVLLDEGYVPQVLNESAAYISAKQRDDVTTGALAGTMAIVTISPDGVLRVEVSGHGLYDSSSDLVRDVKQVQDKLTKEILAAANAPAGAPAGAPPATSSM